MREGVLFARLGLDLIDHPRLMATPPGVRAASLGVYAYAVVYARRHETDGFVPMGAIDQLGCPKEVTEALVSVGLFARKVHDGIHGVLVVKYAEFNETKSEIEARRAKERARWAARKKGMATPPGVNPEHRRSPRGLLVSETESETDLKSSLRSDTRNPVAVAKGTKQRTSKPGTRCPGSDCTPEELREWLDRWQIDPSHPVTQELLDWGRHTGETSKDWKARWRSFERRPRRGTETGRQGVFGINGGGSGLAANEEARKAEHARRLKELEREGLQRALEARRRESSEPKKIGAA